MRYIRYTVLVAMAIVLITVAMANRAPLTIYLLPDELTGLLGFSWQITLPVFTILLVAVGAGVLLGFVWEWVREHKHRAEASTERKRRVELEQEVKTVAKPKAGNGDDVLAILDGR